MEQWNKLESPQTDSHLNGSLIWGTAIIYRSMRPDRSFCNDMNSLIYVGKNKNLISTSHFTHTHTHTSIQRD